MFTVVAAALTMGTTGCTGAPPAGGTIVFVAVGSRGQQIETMRPDGSGVRVLLSLPPSSNDEIDCPRWSPDGKQILVTIASIPPGRNQQNSLYVINADGTGLRLITRDSGLCGSWSPDGTKIVFSGVMGRWPAQILIKNLRTGRLTQLPGGPESGYDPAWSPDGKQIAFEQSISGNADIYVFAEDLASGRVRRVTGALSDGGFAWSPDGRRIAYDGGGHGGMFVVSLRSGVTTSLGRGAFPSWSPDGTRVAFVWPTSPCGDIYVMPVTGPGRTRLTSRFADKSEYCDPVWAP
jgi:Tol biopolymer transport system component